MPFKYKEIHDISVLLSADLPVYPGDSPIKMNQLVSMDKGDSANILELKLGSHTGTHVDVPRHFISNGKSIDEILLEKFCGRAKVYDLPVKEKIDRINILNLDIQTGDIILFKTRNSDLWGIPEFQKNYIYLTVEGAEVLVKHKIKAVGIDYLSIEKFKSKNHPTHITLLKNDVIILEGINLKDVVPGEYFLFFFPLKLKGADGSPVRAVLLK